MLKEVKPLARSSVSAFDFLAHPVLIFSLETLRILASNSAAQDWLGFGKVELEALTIADLQPADERSRLWQQLQAFLEEATDAGMWTIVGKSGTRFEVSFHWKKVLLDGSLAVVATIKDKTEIVDSRNAASDLTLAIEGIQEQSVQTELLFRQIFESAPGKMLVVRPGSYEIVAVTDEYARATMIDPKSVYGHSLFNVFPDDPEDPAADGTRNLQASFRRVESLSTTDIMSAQRHPIRRGDGTFEERHWIPVNKPVFDDAGILAFIIHRVEDISDLVAENDASVHTVSHTASHLDVFLRLQELKASLTALQEKEARLRTAERLLELGPWEYDLETRALHWSPRVFKIYGVPENSFDPDFESYVALVHPDDRKQMIDVYTQFEQTGAQEIVFQHRIVRSDGSIAHIKGVGERHKVDGKEIVVGFVQDISDATTSEIRLAEMNRLQRIAGTMARLGSWRVDLDSPRMTWSPETVAIHEEVPGASPTLEDGINYYAPEHRDKIRSAFSACVEKGRPYDEILQLITAKGNRVWVRTIGEAVRDESGEVVAIEGAFQDISELIAARDEADTLARRLRQTLENISDAFFLVDDAWRFAFVNSRAESLLQRAREELLGKVVWDEFPEAVSSLFQSQYEHAVAEERSVRFVEYFAPLKTWFAVDAYPTPEGLAVYFRDITESRARDEHLRLLETAISRQNDILLITEAEPIEGPDGPKIVYVNEAFVKRTGFAREEVIGKSPRILQGPRTQRSELDRIRVALEKWRPVRAELINYTKSGEEFWLELDIVPIADEKGWFTHWVSVERDISDRKRAEEASRVNNERFRLVAMATNDVIWDWDLVANTVWWNDNLESLCGYAPSDLDPGPESWTSRIHPDDRQRVLDSIHSVIEGPDIHWSSEYRFMHRDGRAVAVVDRGFVICNDQGKAVRMLGSMLDVTQHRDLESRLRQAQKLEAVGQLTGGIAHDFNNILTVILGNAEILSDDLGDHHNLRSLAEMTMTAAQRGAELTKRLLAFARKQALEPKLVDLNQIVAGMESLLRRTLGEQFDVEIIRAGRLWNTEVDVSQLETALLNLAINARDAMPEGGCLTIETANASLDDDYAASVIDMDPGQYVMLIVTDTGHGIEREHFDRIFEPFFTTKEAGKGSGLGLSMVYGFVKQSGGQIRIYSELGEGTTIKLYFPRSHSHEETFAGSKVIGPAMGGHEHILVVEDDRLVREHLVSQLKRLGYRVVDAGSGERALQILERVPDIDLLLTDVVMPGMSGKQLADRALVMRPAIKVLFTSGYTENSIVHNGRLDLGVELLSKPYTRDQLAAKLRKILGR